MLSHEHGRVAVVGLPRDVDARPRTCGHGARLCIHPNGFDIAELHAHLAFARYKASDNDPEVAQATLDLLDYAETIDPGLPILHAYRGAVLVSIGREEEAAEFFDRALYLDPNNKLALAYRRED